ncbi:MAG TPA: hypothetical protein PLU88_02610 [Armatimonadota bacterium]|nr:hypothetical protein [Armatimonadota bacterium]HOP81074.1 hypothetical protein [Armatimonadota bacterium]HPP74004.1 hypothetical protein [Armatimonadota bacterium]
MQKQVSPIIVVIIIVVLVLAGWGYWKFLNREPAPEISPNAAGFGSAPPLQTGPSGSGTPAAPAAPIAAPKGLAPAPK